MIRHVLFIKYKEQATEADIATSMANFEKIKSKIDGIESVEWGENSSPEGRNQGYTHCVFMTFVDDAARDAYIPHPEHEVLKAQLGSILDDIIVFDYGL
ncbi:stress protein [Marinomonas sp. CT5]|uniref:Dabb family protein n=1 Tax=Marinomonas sp. CT5 TaxID=2066133 RepID=UPI0017BAE536|nr:Dabb family protein [Marinomonas sp. CT5]NVK73052.1 Dabb family protein [Oceanospirillaceae bacterium]QUX94405.1 stress protein [Marinomonas sp. CT5]